MFFVCAICNNVKKSFSKTGCKCNYFEKFSTKFMVSGCVVCGFANLKKPFRNKRPNNDNLRFLGLCRDHEEQMQLLVDKIENETIVNRK